MADFRGIEDFVAAVTGGNRFEDAAYNASLTRLTRQRAAQTSLDKQLELLAREKDINANRGDVRNLMTGDDLARAIALSNSGTGANLSGFRSSEKTDLQTQTMQQALDAISGAEQSGNELPTDLINALTGVASGKLLGPTNVQVQPQATSDIRGSEAVAALNEGKLNDLLPVQIEAEQALTDQRNRANIDGGGGLDFEELSSIGLENLILNPDTLPIKTGSTSRIPFVGEDIIENLPLSDPRAQKAWAEMNPDDRAALLQRLAPEFNRWRVAQSTTDPNMTDETYAIGKFLDFKLGQGAAVSGASRAPNPAPVVFVRGPDGTLIPQQ